MNAILQHSHEDRFSRNRRVRTVLRVAQEDRYVGDILLDAQGKVWRHASTIPSDVVLKVFLAHLRQSEVCGQLVSRTDGRTYSWVVVGLLHEAVAA